MSVDTLHKKDDKRPAARLSADTNHWAEGGRGIGAEGTKMDFSFLTFYMFAFQIDFQFKKQCKTAEGFFGPVSVPHLFKYCWLVGRPLHLTLICKSAHLPPRPPTGVVLL